VNARLGFGCKKSTTIKLASSGNSFSGNNIVIHAIIKAKAISDSVLAKKTAVKYIALCCKMNHFCSHNRIFSVL